LWKVSEAAYVEIRQLLRLSEQLTTHLGVMKNQREAICHSVVRSPFALAKLEERIRQTEKDRKEVEKQMEAPAVSLDKESFDHLTGVPGIGRKTATVRGTKQSRTLHGRRTMHTAAAKTRTLRAALDCFVAPLLPMTVVSLSFPFVYLLAKYSTCQ
jgi:hypothetical protein